MALRHSPLDRVPPELRLQMFSPLLSFTKRLHRPTKEAKGEHVNISILLTCKEIWNDSLASLYTSNKFTLTPAQAFSAIDHLMGKYFTEIYLTDYVYCPLTTDSLRKLQALVQTCDTSCPNLKRLNIECSAEAVLEKEHELQLQHSSIGHFKTKAFELPPGCADFENLCYDLNVHCQLITDTWRLITYSNSSLKEMYDAVRYGPVLPDNHRLRKEQTDIFIWLWIEALDQPHFDTHNVLRHLVPLSSRAICPIGKLWVERPRECRIAQLRTSKSITEPSVVTWLNLLMATISRLRALPPGPF